MPFKYTNEEGTKFKLIEMNVKPILLWDIAFPKENLDTVLNSLIGTDGKEHKRSMENRYGFIFKTIIAKLRDKLGLKPVPVERTHDKKFAMYTGNVEILPIGIKEDKDTKDGEGKTVEGL